MSLAQTADEVAILETREASPSHFLVKIESFSLNGKDGIQKYETDEFGAGGYKWKLIIYPNEDKTGIDSDYLSVYLAISNAASLPASWEVNAVFSLFVFNQISCNYLYSLGRTRRFIPVKLEWGISNFMSKKVLKDPSNGFLIDNNCVFGAEVFMVEKPAVLKCLVPKEAKYGGLGATPRYSEQIRQEVAILETREASPSHFLVKIQSFSLNGNYGIHKYQTDEFDAGGYKWKLIIYPNEDKTGIASDYLSVYLAISDTASLPANWEVNAVFSFFVFNQISCNYLYSLGQSRRFIPMKLEWGISKFISKKVLEDPSNGFLIDYDNCVFGAEVFMVEKPAVFKCLVPKKETAPYKRAWEILNFSKLGDVWTSEQFVAGGFNWDVSLYPKGKGSHKGCYLAVYLRLIDSDRVKACFSVSIKDQINNKHNEKYDINSFSDSDWGWPRFIEIATVEDPRNGYIVKDCCLLEIEISILKD